MLKLKFVDFTFIVYMKFVLSTSLSCEQNFVSVVFLIKICNCFQLQIN